MQLRQPALIAASAASAAVVGTSLMMSTSRFRVESPRYVVLELGPGFEIRRYSPRVIAYTVAHGSLKEAQRSAFRRLAGYLFGGNLGDQTIPMTSPMGHVPHVERIEMTSPVEVAPSNSGWRMEFTMPSRFTVGSLPLPRDPEVKFEDIPSRYVAVMRFTWTVDERRARRKMEELRAAVDASPDWESIGEPELAQYDPPWTVPFLRRNEAMVAVRRKTAAS